LTGPSVTFLGGVQPNSPEESELAEAVGRRFGELGYMLRHGGYNGLMERTAQGAASAGAHVVALTLAGKEEWGDFNPYVKQAVHAPDMGERLMGLLGAADVIVGMGGGIGTLHELASAIYYAGNIRRVPVMVVGPSACRLHDFLRAERWLYESPTRPLDFLYTAPELPAFLRLVDKIVGFVQPPRGHASAVIPSVAQRISLAAVVHGRYELADGTVLDEHFDPFRLAADPVLSRELAEVLARQLGSVPDVVVGLALGGVPLAVDLSRVLQRPLLLARTQPKAYGTQARIEGVPVPGHRALLVDDVVRSGRQMTEVAGVLRDAGLTVTDATCILLRSPAGRRLLQEHGIRLQSFLPPSFARGDDGHARPVGRG
jgi:uncharacterized protein (TIGR00725 family)